MKKHPNSYRSVLFVIWSKNLSPDEITKKIGIEPDSYIKKGIKTNSRGEIMKDKNGKPKRFPINKWILKAHVHENSGFDKRIENILKRIKPYRAAIKKLLKTEAATLDIIVEPHIDLMVRSLFVPSHLANEFASLGVDIQISIHITHNWMKFKKEVFDKRIKKKKK